MYDIIPIDRFNGSNELTFFAPIAAVASVQHMHLLVAALASVGANDIRFEGAAMLWGSVMHLTAANVTAHVHWGSVEGIHVAYGLFTRDVMMRCELVSSGFQPVAVHNDTLLAPRHITGITPRCFPIRTAAVSPTNHTVAGLPLSLAAVCMSDEAKCASPHATQLLWMGMLAYIDSLASTFGLKYSVACDTLLHVTVVNSTVLPPLYAAVAVSSSAWHQWIAALQMTVNTTSFTTEVRSDSGRVFLRYSHVSPIRLGIFSTAATNLAGTAVMTIQAANRAVDVAAVPRSAPGYATLSKMCANCRHCRTESRSERTGLLLSSSMQRCLAVNGSLIMLATCNTSV